MLIEAVVWDFDGTIVDTETPQYEAWDTVFQEHGARMDPRVWGEMVGTHSQLDLLDVLEREVGPVHREAMARRVRALEEQYLASAPLRPGVGDLLKEFREAKVPSAIASSSHRQWIRRFLEAHAIERHFQGIASADDVREVKPDPAVYVLAVRILGKEPGETLAIEDSAHGATAALAAGLRCLVVPNPSTERLLFPAGVVRVPTLAGVTLPILEQLFSD